jgi:D-alanine transaminase/branched-chain amino acid aminotransferase
MAIWLQPFIKKRGAEDVLYISDGLISECPRANFFLLAASNKLVTPRKGILEGITRKNILACARELDVEVEERDVLVSEIASARGAFICSTTKGLFPVSSINEKDFETDIAIFTTLQAALADRIAAYHHAKSKQALS